MATAVRVQGPGAAITLSFEDGATLDDLRQRIASSELAIPASLQELRVGFPPQVLGAVGSALIFSELGSSARVLVKSTGGSAEISGGTGGGSSGGASSSPAKAGGGRKKAQVQRVQDGANPRDVQARADAVAAAAAAQRAAAAQEAEDLANQEGRGKRARTQQRFLTPEESAAELLGEDAPAPRKKHAPKPAAAPAAEPSDADADADPPASKASAKASAKAPGKASGRAAKAKTAEQIAQEYFLGANSASKQPGRSGTTAYLTDLGTIEHRAEAVKQRKYELLEVGAGAAPTLPTYDWPTLTPTLAPAEPSSGGSIAAAGHLQGDAQAGVRDGAAAARGGDPRRVGGARLARQQQPRPRQQPPALAARDGDALPRAALVPRPRLRRRRGGRRATATRLRG